MGGDNLASGKFTMGKKERDVPGGGLGRGEFSGQGQIPLIR